MSKASNVFKLFDAIKNEPCRKVAFYMGIADLNKSEIFEAISNLMRSGHVDFSITNNYLCLCEPQPIEPPSIRDTSSATSFKMRIYSFSLPRSDDDLTTEVSFDSELAFIPRIGDQLSVTTSQAYGLVRDVVITPYLTDEHERISVYLAIPDELSAFSEMAAEGWKSA